MEYRATKKAVYSQLSKSLMYMLVKKKEEEMVKLQNPNDNTGYMLLK